GIISHSHCCGTYHSEERVQAPQVRLGSLGRSLPGCRNVESHAAAEHQRKLLSRLASTLENAAKSLAPGSSSPPRKAPLHRLALPPAGFQSVPADAESFARRLRECPSTRSSGHGSGAACGGTLRQIGVPHRG